MILPWKFTTVLVQECNNVAAVVILKVSVILLTFLSICYFGCGVYSCTPSLYILDASNTSRLPFVAPKRLQTLPSDTVYFSVTLQFIVYGPVRILEWVAVSFYSGSFQPRDGTQVSHITGRVFTS